MQVTKSAAKRHAAAKAPLRRSRRRKATPSDDEEDDGSPHATPPPTRRSRRRASLPDQALSSSSEERREATPPPPRARRQGRLQRGAPVSSGRASRRNSRFVDAGKVSSDDYEDEGAAALHLLASLSCKASLLAAIPVRCCITCAAYEQP